MKNTDEDKDLTGHFQSVVGADMALQPFRMVFRGLGEDDTWESVTEYWERNPEAAKRWLTK